MIYSVAEPYSTTGAKMEGQCATMLDMNNTLDERRTVWRWKCERCVQAGSAANVAEINNHHLHLTPFCDDLLLGIWRERPTH